VFTAASDPQDPITETRRDVGDLRLELVVRRKEMLLWRELIARYHYLGYTPLTGARMHYLIRRRPAARRDRLRRL
jgi:hypothetical protein